MTDTQILFVSARAIYYKWELMREHAIFCKEKGITNGSTVFTAWGNGVASLEELDYGPFGPWYPRISRAVGPVGSGEIIYPTGEEFPPGEVRAVAMKDAVAILLADLDRVGKSENS